MEHTLFELDKTTYLQRIFLSLKKNARLFKFLGILVITIPSTIHISFPIGSLVAVIFFILLFFLPILIMECKTYIYSIKRIENEIEIRYQYYNYDKVLIVSADQLRFLELKKDMFSLTVNNVRVYLSLNKTEVKKLLDQYRIVSWANDDLLSKLIQEFRGK